MTTNWPAIRAGIFKGESGGDYNTLYGHVERNGPFAGTKLSDMTVDQALAFNSPTGPYGQYARSKGIAAAPLGAYQIIHSTLKGVKNGMGLTGNERMTPDLQEKMGQYIYSKQGTGAWAGYRGPGDPSAYAPPSPYAGFADGPKGQEAYAPPGLGGGDASGLAVATNSPGGGILGSIPQDVADYAAAPEPKPFGERLGNAFKALTQTPDAPQVRFGQMGDARASGDSLLKALAAPKISDAFLRKRLA